MASLAEVGKGRYYQTLDPTSVLVGAGSSQELAPLVAPAGLRPYITPITGYEIKTATHPHHSGMAGIMTGARYHQVGTTRDTIVSTFAHPSVDQIAAARFEGWADRARRFAAPALFGATLLVIWEALVIARWLALFVALAAPASAHDRVIEPGRIALHVGRVRGLRVRRHPRYHPRRKRTGRFRRRSCPASGAHPTTTSTSPKTASLASMPRSHSARAATPSTISILKMGPTSTATASASIFFQTATSL